MKKRPYPRPVTGVEFIEALANRLEIAEIAGVAVAPEPDQDDGYVYTPQAGPQAMLDATDADITIYGGEAGGGKTFGIINHVRHHLDVPGFTATYFRRIEKQIQLPGGLWADSEAVYPHYGGVPRSSELFWQFPSRASVQFAGLQYEHTVHEWKGAQICGIYVDQLEELLESQFWYILSRNRLPTGVTGVKPYLIATANPLPNWLSKFLDWWIDDDGYPIPERSGKKRWLQRVQERLLWADSRDELWEKAKAEGVQKDRFQPMTVVFIRARLEDNPALMKKDPKYLSNLENLSTVERERLRGGNWHIMPEAGKLFNRAHFELVHEGPGRSALRRLRYWDKAATPGSGDHSAGVLMSESRDGFYYIEDVQRGQWDSDEREALIRQTASLDNQLPGPPITTWIEQEPGSSGKDSARWTIKGLAGYDVRAWRPTGDKEVRSRPLQAQVQIGRVRVLIRDWTEAFLHEMHNFTWPAPILPDDQVDAASGAFARLVLTDVQFEAPPSVTQVTLL